MLFAVAELLVYLDFGFMVLTQGGSSLTCNLDACCISVSEWMVHVLYPIVLVLFIY